MKVVMLAGGKGERLMPLTKDIPKPMIELGGKPLLWYVFKNARKWGFRDFLFKTGYMSERVKEYFGDGSRFGCRINYFEEKELLGTSGGLHFLSKEEEPIIVLYGDVIADINLKRLVEFHRKHKADATLVVHSSSHPEDSDIIVKKGNVITQLIHKPGTRAHGNLSNAALYVMEAKCFGHAAAKGDFAKDLIPRLLKHRHKVVAYETEEYLRDIGTIGRLEDTKKDLKRIFAVDAVFLDRDGTINHERDLLTKVEELEILDGAADGIRKLNARNIPVIVVTNQPVIARGLCDEEDVRNINHAMISMLQKKGAVIDALYYCPHHPERHHNEGIPELRIECDCRKPKIGMLKVAQEQFMLDLGRCFMVGDTTRDILTGKNAGCKTVLVKTGYRGKDDKYTAIPDYEAADLDEAADIILKATNL